MGERKPIFDRTGVPARALLLVLAIIIVAVARTVATGRSVPVDNYDEKMAAYHKMEELSQRVKVYKTELGIGIDPKLDILSTGLIGVEYSGITTTLGSLDAKRTAAHPMMAAMMIDLFEEKNLGKGSRVGVVMSGSFPGLNLAVLSACEVLEIQCVYITSIGSSSFGGNNPELPFPLIAEKLYEDGLITQKAAAFSIGGTDDIGTDMDAVVLETSLEILKAENPKFLYQPDYGKNLKSRMDILEQYGELDAFINVGGHMSGMGGGEDSYYFPVGWINQPLPLNEKSGLLAVYNNKGIPVLHLLNVRKLAEENGLPYDPIKQEVKEPFYYTRHPKAFGICGLAGVALILFKTRKKCEN